MALFPGMRGRAAPARADGAAPGRAQSARARRRVPLAAAAAILVATEGAAQAPSPDERPRLQMMRAEEDWRGFGSASLRAQPLDALKLVRLGAGTTLTFGGEARVRAESYAPFDIGFGLARDGGYGLGRVMLHADLRVGDGLRAFVQFRHGSVWGSRRDLGPAQANDLDFNQAFVEAGAATASGRWSLRLGRQELLFGSGRLVAPRDGPNARLSFDGVRTGWSDGPWRVDAFALRPVLPRGGAFDDRSSARDQFWGVYATSGGPAAPLGFDLYYLGLDRARVAFARGAAAETRHTVGARLFGRSGPWDWDLEAAYQFGRFGAAGIGAYTLANDVGYSLPALPWSPRIGLRLDVASGDGSLRGRRLGAFEVPFPKLPYLTEGSFVAPTNIVDVHPSLTLQPAPDLRVTFEHVAVWKHRIADAFYVPPLRAVPGTAGRGRFVGHLLQVGARWDPHPQVTVEAAVVRMLSGDAVRGAGGRDSTFAMVAATFRF